MEDDLNDDGYPPYDDLDDGLPPDDDTDDAGDDAGEGEPDQDGDDQQVNDDAGDQQRTARQPSRAERRVAEAVRRAKEAETERDRLKAEAEALRRQQQQPSPQQIADYQRQRAERLAFMDPDQRVEFLLGEQQQNFQHQLQQIRHETADGNDRAAFRSLCAAEPAYAKVADEVERVLREERAAGRGGASREVVAQWLIGKRAIDASKRAGPKQRRQGRERIAQQQGRPGSGGSDVQAPSRRSGRDDDLSALEKRLGKVAI